VLGVNNHNLKELTSLARKYAKGAKDVDKRSVRCVVLPCPVRFCHRNGTHIHMDRLERGLIALEPSELGMPKHLQEYLIAHEVTHLHTKKGHRSNIFKRIQSKFIPNYEEMNIEYWRYRDAHRGELRAAANQVLNEKHKVPELSYEEKIEKAELHIKMLERKIKRLATLRTKWGRRLKAYQRLKDTKPTLNLDSPI